MSLSALSKADTTSTTVSKDSPEPDRIASIREATVSMLDCSDVSAVERVVASAASAAVARATSASIDACTIASPATRAAASSESAFVLATSSASIDACSAVSAVVARDVSSTSDAVRSLSAFTRATDSAVIDAVRSLSAFTRAVDSAVIDAVRSLSAFTRATDSAVSAAVARATSAARSAVSTASAAVRSAASSESAFARAVASFAIAVAFCEIVDAFAVIRFWISLSAPSNALTTSTTVSSDSAEPFRIASIRAFAASMLDCSEVSSVVREVASVATDASTYDLVAASCAAVGSAIPVTLLLFISTSEVISIVDEPDDVLTPATCDCKFEIAVAFVDTSEVSTASAPCARSASSAIS